jgi:TetR/AcrR family transcriptional regulator, mexJK operon transcriptional repressor
MDILHTHAGRPKDLEKRQRILESAKRSFLEFGYHGSNMNRIAQIAGVTKLTVYNHFKDKATLFTCAIEDTCESIIHTHLQALDEHTDFMPAFFDACELSFNIVNLPEAIKLEYLLLELASQHNPLVQQFYDASHAKLCAVWERFFEQAVQFKFIKADKPINQTSLIMSLLLGNRHHEVLLGVKKSPNPDEQHQIIQNAIQIFMLKYGI